MNKQQINMKRQQKYPTVSKQKNPSYQLKNNINPLGLTVLKKNTGS